MRKLLFVFVFILIFSCGCTLKSEEEVIKFSTWGSASELSVLEPVIKEFETQNPGIKVEILHVPQDYFKKLHLLFASRTEPDIIMINNLNIPEYSKFLYDLTDFIEKDLFFDKSIQSVSFGGRVYAVPRDCSGLVIYYNKTLFDKCSLAYPDKNWTMEDLFKTALLLSNNNFWGISYEPSVYYAQPFMHYFGGGVFKNGSFAGDSFESLKGVSWYKELAYKYHCAPIPSEVGGKTLAQMFLEGKIAMHISGRWMVPKYTACAKFSWDVINFPEYFTSSDSTGWAISKRSKHKDSALKLLLFLSSKESIEAFAKSGLIVPARKDVACSKAFLEGKPNNSKIFIESVEKSDITQVDTDYNKKIEQLNEMFFTGK